MGLSRDMTKALRASCALILPLNLHPPRLEGQGQPIVVRAVQMGMEVRISAFGDSGAVLDAADAAFARIDALEWILSHWRPGSELSRLGTAPAGTWVAVSPPLFAVLSSALRVAAATDGAFDPTLGALTALWRASRDSGMPVDPAAVERARMLSGWQLVALDSARRMVRLTRSPIPLDLGGIAKGWILGDVRELMRARSVPRVLIEAGGDIVAGDAPPGTAGWRIAVDGDTVITVANAAVSTSGPGAQWITDSGTRRSHVIDTRSGLGRADQPTITVIGADPAITDALATQCG